MLKPSLNLWDPVSSMKKYLSQFSKKKDYGNILLVFHKNAIIPNCFIQILSLVNKIFYFYR